MASFFSNNVVSVWHNCKNDTLQPRIMGTLYSTSSELRDITENVKKIGKQEE